MCWARAVDGAAFEIDELDALRSEHRDFAVAQEENAARVREDRGNIAGDEKFMLAQADHDGRTEARGDDFVGIFGGDGDQRVGAAHHFHGFQNGFFERGVLGKFLEQVGDDFGVGFGLRTCGPRRGAAFSARCNSR